MNSQKMDPIPDHCIQSPFGRLTPAAIINDDRFNKYRAHIVPWYQELYDKYMYVTSGFTCDVCGSRMSSTKSGAILGHFASKKHLRAAGVLEEKDHRNRRGVGYQHTIYGADAIISEAVCGVGECANDE